MPPKKKKNLVKAAVNNAEIQGMFAGLLGGGDEGANPAVTWPKYKKLIGLIDRYQRALALLSRIPVMQLEPVMLETSIRAAEEMAAAAAATFTAPNLEPYIHRNGPEGMFADKRENYDKVPHEQIAQFTAVYSALKTAPLVTGIILTCDKLVAKRAMISDAAALKDHFLTKTAGSTYAPLHGIPINFKALYQNTLATPEDRKFILLILNKFYTISHEVYEVVTSSDMDMDEVSEVLISSISTVEKELPRCGDAFRQIRGSIGLLRNNLPEYQKDYVISNNPSVIMEHFVRDVAAGSDVDAKTTGQFNQIIKKYRSMAAANANSPQIRAIFAHVDANYRNLQERQRRAELGEELTDDDEEDGDGDGDSDGDAGEASGLSATE